MTAFAVGVLFVYFDRFRTIRLAGDHGDPVVVDGDDHVRDSNRAARFGILGVEFTG